MSKLLVKSGEYLRPGLVALCLAVGATMSGCRYWSDDVVKVSVTYSPTDPQAEPLAEVTIISGGDKHGWYDHAAGSTRSATLYPDSEDGDRELTLFYTLGGQERRVWESPKMPLGRGYRIHVVIGADGVVSSYRHCLLPCTLDERVS